MSWNTARAWFGRLILAGTVIVGVNGFAQAKNVEAGPIWNQADAEKKCPAVAKKEGGTWNGQWRTTVPGKMSVCGVDIKTRNVNAGPIWNQADAEKKCPALAKMEKGRWNGEWRTVEPNVSSVCGIEYPIAQKQTQTKAERDRALREHAAKIQAQNEARRKAEQDRLAKERAEREQAERDQAAVNEAANSEEAAALVAAMAGLFGQGEVQTAQNNSASSTSSGSSSSAGGSSGGYQKAYSADSENAEEKKCHNMVQGKVAWNWEGTRSWNQGNIDRLCNNTQSAENTVVCFEGVMAIRDDWSRAIDACSL